MKDLYAIIDGAPLIYFEMNDEMKEYSSRYRGFEGEAVTVSTDYKEILEFYRGLKDSQGDTGGDNRLRLLMICTDRDESSDTKGFEYIGLEYGYCTIKGDVYSSVFCEVVLAHVEQLGEYRKKLNCYSLFSEMDVVTEYGNVHRELNKEGGYDIEWEDGLEILHIWKYRDGPS